MKNIANLNIEGPVTLNVQGGDVVVRGREEGTTAQVIARGRGVTVKRHESGMTINAEGPILTLPADTPLTIEGSMDNVVLKGLNAVRLEGCHGDLAANRLASLEIQGDIHGDAALRQIGGELTLSSVHGDVAIREAGRVRLAQIHGDISIGQAGDIELEGTEGDLAVDHAGSVTGQQINGDVSLGQVGAVQFESIEGDLTIHNASSLTVKTVQGDVTLTALDGAVTLGRVEGDLVATALGPSLTADVSGDVRLAGELRSNGEYMVRADGDVRVMVSGNIHFVVRTEGDIEWGGAFEVEDGDDGAQHAYLGSREEAATLTIESQGDVHINADHEEHGHHRHYARHGQYEAEVEREVREAMREVQSEVRRATATAREELKRALRESERAMGEGVAIGNIVSTTLRDVLSAIRPPIPPVPPVPPVPPRPVSHRGGSHPEVHSTARTGASSESGRAAERESTSPSEELQTILQMVQDGTITPEQAEALIRALG